jgi:site-specific recombinase XerD
VSAGRGRRAAVRIRFGGERLLARLGRPADPARARHFCASSLYARGMDLKAVQELLGHEWLSTTTRYIHVHDNHVETAWATANERVTARLTTGTE